MEENSTQTEITNMSTIFGESPFPRIKKLTKSNTYPLRIRKENEVDMRTFMGQNIVNSIFQLESKECINMDKVVIVCDQKRVEDESAVNEGGYTGNLQVSNGSQVLPNSISFPNFEVALNGRPEPYETKETTSCKAEGNSLTDVVEMSRREDLNQTEGLHRASLDVDTIDCSNQESEWLSRRSSHARTPDQSTNSQEVVELNLHESRPQRPRRSSSSPRSEAPPTQVQIDPLNNLPLSSHVEEAFGLFSQFKSYQPTIGSAIFSILMTIIFVGILWIVVFTIFGPKGHAIAGIFLSIFILGFLLNTCFIKFYFRLRLFFGIEHLREQSIRARNLANLEQQREDELRQQRAMEPPPSYSSVIESPPPYSVAKSMKPQIVEDLNVKFQPTIDSIVTKSPENSDMKLQQAVESNTSPNQAEVPSLNPTTLKGACRNCLMEKTAPPTLCSACKSNVADSDQK